jgi:hypothetical protein
MAGFREFVTGEVLTAANVNDFLGKQAVMKFADAAARDAALGTAVVSPNALREGMVAYLDDTDEVIKYDGTDWTSVGGGAAVKQIVSASDSTDRTTTSATFVDVTNVTVTITPTSATSKIVVLCSLSAYSQRTDENSTDSYFQLADGSDVALAGAEGLRVGSSNTLRVGSTFQIFAPVTLVAIVEPATTSAVTYKARFRRGATLAGILGGTNTSKIYAIEVDV